MFFTSSTVAFFSSKFACADFDVFRQVILMVLFWRLHRHVGSGAISIALGHAEIVLQDGAVAEMSVSVTFGASVFVPQILNFRNRSEYATLFIFSATAVREMAVSVTFGAPRSGLPVTFCRRPIVGHIARTGHGRRFSTNARLNSRWAGVIANAKLHAGVALGCSRPFKFTFNLSYSYNIQPFGGDGSCCHPA